MYADMENWSEICRRVLVEGVSRRQILRETGMHWRTLRKMLKHSEPPGYQQSKPRTKKKLEAYVGRIEQILKEDQAMPRKQRHTAKRIWERLKGEGFSGGYTIVKDTVRELTAHPQEGFRSGGSGDAAQTAAHGQTDLGATEGGGIQWRLHDRQRHGSGADGAPAGGVRAANPPTGRGAGGFWRSAGEPEWEVTEGAFFRDGPAA